MNAPASPKKRRTWLWILVGILGLGVLAVIAIAGVGIYFASHHFKSERTTSAEAFRTFDEVRAQFKDVKPLFEIDRREEPRLTRRIEDLPTSDRRVETMHVIAWDPDKERLARVSLPLWMLRLGRRKIDLTSGGFRFDQLNIDLRQLERVGPILIFDYRPQTGQRVLVWTQ
jgi:hypothetical protein